MIEQIELTLSGMTCHACAQLIQEELSETQGVTRAEVNFEQRRARVEFNPSLVETATLIKRITELGYQASLV
jgi:Cu+-exporting ATPase